MQRISQHGAMLGMAWLVFLAVGCAQKAADPAAGGAAQTSTVEAGHDDHSGWWCNAHGVPEEECGQCDSALAADLQRKGDWCREHDRPDSQCFACHPEFEAQFAARYEAKYGKQPPKPEG
jgi:cobalt-zinc-cadmium efflux system membrane fusion protein